MAILPFIFGDGTGLTYEEIQHRRKLAETLAGRKVAPLTAGAGLMNMGSSLAAGLHEMLANRADRKNKAEWEEKWEEFAPSMYEGMGEDYSINVDMGGFGGGYAPAPAGGAPAFQGGNLPLMGDEGPTKAALEKAQVLKGIIQTAEAMGADPLDLATIVSFETGGTFDPLQVGPTTKWGQHRGLIQFGEPQAQQFGVNWDDPIASQLGPDGAVAKYFLANGYQPGMPFADMYSIVNAGEPGRLGASDGNMGTVADKVNSPQMMEHRRKAAALLGLDPNAVGAPGATPAQFGGSISISGRMPRGTDPERVRRITEFLADPYTPEPMKQQLKALLDRELGMDEFRFQYDQELWDRRMDAMEHGLQLEEFGLEREKFGHQRSVDERDLGLKERSTRVQERRLGHDMIEADETTNTDEYEFYRRQEEAAGRTPKSFEKWMTDIKRAGSDKPDIPAGLEKVALDAISEADTLADDITQMSLIKSAVESGGETGPFTPITKFFKGVFNQFGIDELQAQNVPLLDLINSLSAQQVIGVMEKLKGTASEGDREVVERTMASIGKNRLSNLGILTVMLAMARRQQALLEEKANYILTNKDLRGWTKHREEFLKNFKMFTDQDIATLAEVQKPTLPANDPFEGFEIIGAD